ncbi:hypothetical protein LCGC14_2272900, partial [marine sediment metagenome]
SKLSFTGEDMINNSQEGRKIPLREILKYFESRGFPNKYVVMYCKYGKKKVDAKIDKMARKGYIEYGITARSGWLTEKGKQKLEDL